MFIFFILKLLKNYIKIMSLKKYNAFKWMKIIKYEVENKIILAF